MTVTTAKPQVKTPVKPAGAQAAKTAPPPPPSPRRRGVTPLTPMRVQAAKSMSRLAGKVKESHPDLPAGQHLMDAARTLRQGNEEASQRHLRAAIFSLAPQSLMRNGMHTDDLHIGARAVMHGVHRHLLLVKDITDVAAKNEAALQRDSYGDAMSAPMPPQPNAGFGPGALAQKPTARQPPGNQALNAPNRADGGGTDPAVADPAGKQPAGSKQFTREEHPMGYTWNDVSAVIDMCAAPRRVVDLARPWLPSAEYWKSVGSGGGSHPPDKGGSDEEKADNHIKDAKTASMQGNHAGAAAHLARASALTSDPAKQSKINTVGKGAAQVAMQAGKGSAFQLANDGGAVTAGPKGGSGRSVIDLDWAAWDAGHRGGGSASKTAHDTASATAKATVKRKAAARAAARAGKDTWTAKPASPGAGTRLAERLAAPDSEQMAIRARQDTARAGVTRPVRVGDDMPSKGFSQPGGLKASKLTAGDKVEASYGGGPAGLKMHDVTGVKHQTTITVRNTRTGKTHVQKVNSESKRSDGKAFSATKPGDKIQAHYRGDPLGGTDEYQVVKAKHQTTLKTADPDTGEEHTQVLNSNGNVKMSRKMTRIDAASARTQAAGQAKRAATRAIRARAAQASPKA